MEHGRLQKVLLAITWILMLAPRVEAQVGITSGVAQVALVVRVQPRGSIQGVAAQREHGMVGDLREVSVGVGVSANTGYRLLVRQSGAASGRIWVRTVSGQFEELPADRAIIVASDSRRAGQWEKEVRYRVEALQGTDAASPLPVRFEIAIDPTL